MSEKASACCPNAPNGVRGNNVLADDVVNAARNGIKIALEERRESLNLEISEIRASSSMRGVLYGTPYLFAVKQRIATEFKIRAQIAWQNWARALSTQAAVQISDLRARLITEIET